MTNFNNFQQFALDTDQQNNTTGGRRRRRRSTTTSEHFNDFTVIGDFLTTSFNTALNFIVSSRSQVIGTLEVEPNEVEYIASEVPENDFEITDENIIY